MRSQLAFSVGLAVMLANAPATAAPRTPGATETICRANRLVGYGLVVGLNDTGDSFTASPMTFQALKATIDWPNQPSFDPSPLEHKVAFAMVVAYLKSCAYSDGSYDLKLDRTVDLKLSAMGDAKSLQGGALLMTRLYGADGQTYVMGQGVLAVCPDSTAPDTACIGGGGVVAK